MLKSLGSSFTPRPDNAVLREDVEVRGEMPRSLKYIDGRISNYGRKAAQISTFDYEEITSWQVRMCKMLITVSIS